MLVEVLLGPLGVRLHAVLAWLPTGRAHFTVHVSELEGFHESQGFFDTAAHRQVVDGNLSDGLVWADDEKPTEKDEGMSGLQ